MKNKKIQNQLLLKIIYYMILAEKGMRDEFEKYQRIMYELFEISKIIRDCDDIGMSHSKAAQLEELQRAQNKLDSLKPELAPYDF